MCWYSKKLIKTVAKRDVICYKILRPIDDTKATAPIYDDYIYMKGKVTSSVKIYPEYDSAYKIYSIRRGYHSYTTIPNLCDASSTEAIYRMIIPKGAVYYKSDRYKEIVSTNIIMQQRISFGKELKNITLLEILSYIWSRIKEGLI